MSVYDFHALADAELNRWVDALEEADANGQLELELQGGILTLVLPAGKTLLLSKHAVSEQLWLSSPLSGGLHFGRDTVHQAWRLPDGRSLEEVLRTELAQLAGVVVP